MGCSCHGASRKSADVTKPLDQCAVCAKKHFDDAFGCWSEFLYTEANRDHIHRQLRAAVNHTFRAHPDLARKIRIWREKSGILLKRSCSRRMMTLCPVSGSRSKRRSIITFTKRCRRQKPGSPPLRRKEKHENLL